MPESIHADLGVMQGQNILRARKNRSLEVKVPKQLESDYPGDGIGIGEIRPWLTVELRVAVRDESKQG